MKKQILSLLVAVQVFTLQAQVLNSSFENLNASGSIKNWGNVTLIAIIIDSTGNPTDSLRMDNQFYFSTNDAHSGIRAMEMRNAYFYVSGQQIAGQASLMSNDSNYSTFADNVPVIVPPLGFSFYYKFYPANNDTAFAWLRVYDQYFTQVGEATIDITGTNAVYALASANVVYTSQDSAAFMEIGFATAKPGSSANFGTRFLVDDVDLLLTGIDQPAAAQNRLSCFPDPASDQLSFRITTLNAGEKTELSLSDISGRVQPAIPYSISGNQVSADVSTLSPGVYFITVNSGANRYLVKFVKND